MMVSANAKAVEEANSLRLRGNELFRNANFRKAVELYTQSLALSESIQAYSNRAQAHLELGKWVEFYLIFGESFFEWKYKVKV